MKNRPTIYDIASEAKTSTAAVSLVLNNRAGNNVSEKVKKRVLEVAKNRNYRPNAVAQGLAYRRTLNINLCIFGEFSKYNYVDYHGVFDEMRKFIEEVSNAAYFVNIVEIPSGSSFNKIMQKITVKEADGYAFFRSWSDIYPRVMRSLHKKGVPYVGVNLSPPNKEVNYNCICLDRSKGSYIAMEHLVTLGHKRIALIAGEKNRQIIKGYEQALREHNLQPMRAKGTRQNIDPYMLGYLSTMKLMARKKRPSGIVCEDDIDAFGALYALAEKGIKVPDAVSVVGFGDDEYASMVIPKLTTVRQPHMELGRKAARRLIDWINDPDYVPERKVLEPQLIIRDSSRKAAE